jgi:cation diffusion facilitator CzcD-associated flavoprotein CzcO
MMERTVRVVIVGAGLGGISAAIKLKRAGFDTFTVYEKAAGPGGVWWQNTYPGCEVDIPSHAYSFSFMPYDWSGTHASQPELQHYAEDLIDRFGIRGHFRFGTEVRQAVWQPGRSAYAVTLDNDEVVEADLLVSAVGMLSHPKLPSWRGLDRFEGAVFHTSRWDHALDMTGKRVALVGTGSSACQLGPQIAPSVARLDVYQREPGHVLPKRERLFNETERRRFRRFSLLQRIERTKLFWTGRRMAAALRVGSERHRRVESVHAHYLEKCVEDPQTREALTPDFPYGCKRPIFASTWYPMFNRENVHLIPHAVQRVTPHGVIDAAGAERPADVLILSTGFQASNYLATLPVRGPGERWLADVWTNGPWGLLGITVPGFPNFTMMYGPNTNGGFSIMTQHEIQAAAIVRLARWLRRRPAFDTREALARGVDDRVQRRIGVAMSTISHDCHNYYYSTSGKNVTQWPFSHTAYRLAARALLPLAITNHRADEVTETAINDSVEDLETITQPSQASA